MNQQRPETFVKVIDSLINSFPLREGDTWFLLNYNWYARWKHTATTQPSFHMDSIENAILLDDEIVLKKGLVEGHDFIIVPQEVWNKLKIFGFDYELPRRVIKSSSGELLIEIYQINLNIVLKNDPRQKN